MDGRFLPARTPPSRRDRERAGWIDLVVGLYGWRVFAAMTSTVHQPFLQNDDRTMRAYGGPWRDVELWTVPPCFAASADLVWQLLPPDFSPCLIVFSSENVLKLSTALSASYCWQSISD